MNNTTQHSLTMLFEEIRTDVERNVTGLPLNQQGQQLVVSTVFGSLNKLAEFLTRDNDAAIGVMQDALCALESVPTKTTEMRDAIKSLKAQLVVE